MLLRKSSVQFKDYAGKPIGFGIVLFCLAKRDCRELYAPLYHYYYDYDYYYRPHALTD